MSKSLLAAALLMSGCTWAGARGRDLADIVRVEGAVGVGLQAHVNATELLHLGLGSSRRWSGGWAYGHATSERRVEDHLPLSFVRSVINPEAEALHSLRLGSKNDILKHRCPAIAPCTLQDGSIRKPPIHFWDIEIGVMLIAVGAEVGFNPGELADFFLGLFGFDIAGDDDEEGRARRRLWIPSGPDLRSEP